MRVFIIFVASLLLGITASQGTDQNEFQKRRPQSWSPNMDTRINVDGRNILLPKEYAGSLDTGLNKLVPVFRTEADPNRRIFPGGVDDKNKMLFVGVNSDPKRTEHFMQQSRFRETQREIGQGKQLKNRFDANGQTVRYGSISPTLARKIIFSSMPERLNERTQAHMSLKPNPDIKNVDITKAHNQFGVKGQTLSQLKNEIKQNGVGEGTTYFGRRRSEPGLITSRNGLFEGGSSSIGTKPNNANKGFGSTPSLVGSSTSTRALPGTGSGLRRASFGGFPTTNLGSSSAAGGTSSRRASTGSIFGTGGNTRTQPDYSGSFGRTSTKGGGIKPRKG